jgi:hypothetical protein
LQIDWFFDILSSNEYYIMIFIEILRPIAINVSYRVISSTIKC